MENSVSDHSFYMDSEEEEDVEKQSEKDEDDGSNSDYSNYFDDAQTELPQRKLSSLHPSWPQSYKQSIDLYGSLPSPSLNFQGTPILSRFGSSFLSSSLTRRHTPDVLPTLNKPLLPPVEDEHPPHHKRSSHHLLPPRRPSVRKLASDHKSSIVSHEVSVSGESSSRQAILNGINVLCGVGILTTPYAVKVGGWYGLAILLIYGPISFYTGLLLRRSLDSQPGLKTYPDIGQAAFGSLGRYIISIILYVELYASCVEYIILESDNLSSLFPNAHLNILRYVLNPHNLFAIVTALAVLPTVWLRNLSVLSYISAGGVLASVLVVICLFWLGLVDQVGFVAKSSPALNLSNLPVAIGLYGFCYSGHAVFPNIYSSMKKPSQFPMVLLICFGVCTVFYGGVAVMGNLMFGESTLSQFTLNMPQDYVSSKIAVWTTIINPFTKYALTISPVAMSLEELIPLNHQNSHLFSILIRTLLVLSTLVVALTIPFFDLVMALIGSLLTMLVTLILPCLCYLSIHRQKTTRFEKSFCALIIVVGGVSAASGTWSALTKIIQELGW